MCEGLFYLLAVDFVFHPILYLYGVDLWRSTAFEYTVPMWRRRIVTATRWSSWYAFAVMEVKVDQELVFSTCLKCRARVHSPQRAHLISHSVLPSLRFDHLCDRVLLGRAMISPHDNMGNQSCVREALAQESYQKQSPEGWKNSPVGKFMIGNSL